MKTCNKCGKVLKDEHLFCNNCGTKANFDKQNYQENMFNNDNSFQSNNQFEPKKKLNMLVEIVLWVIFLPIMLIISIVKSQKLKRFHKAILIVLVVIFAIQLYVPNNSSFISRFGELCSTLGALCLFSLPILCVMFLIKWLTKKPKNVIGICMPYLFIGGICLMIIGGFISLAGNTTSNKSLNVKNTLFPEKHVVGNTTSNNSLNVVATESREPIQNEKSQGSVNTIIALTPEEIQAEKNEESAQNINDYGIENDELRTNILKAFEDISVDITSLKKFNIAGEWNGGNVWNINYRNATLNVYVYNDNRVNSINIGDVRVYEEGYQSLDIDDFLLEIDEAYLQIAAEDSVKSVLNNPLTANFSWLDWKFGRAYDIYTVSGSLTAKNSLGVKSEMKFYLEYSIGENKSSTKYFVLDNVVVLGSKSVINIPKVAVANNNENTNDEPTTSIQLQYGQKGDYGKEINDNNYTYIVYDLPAGKYNITTIMNSTVVMLISKTTYLNSDNRKERKTIERIEITKDSKDVTVELTGTEYIVITSNSKVSFIPLP